MNDSVKWQIKKTITEGDKFQNAEEEIFKSGRWAFLAREVIQNSNDAFDAMNNNNEKLIIEFSMKKLPISDFPDLKTFKDHINGTLSIKDLPVICKNNCEASLKKLSNSFINVLKISDYNTTGVTGSDNLYSITSPWKALIYDEGNSQKNSSQAAGSFGLGKNAPFALSSINTVFYSTKDINGLYAFEGVAKLYTSYIDGEKVEPKFYYAKLGDNNRTYPLRYGDCNNLNEIFKRYKCGTDIFIMCVDADVESIKKEIIQAVLENFFIRIIDKKIEIKIFNEIINDETIENMVLKYCDKPIEYTSSNIKYGYINQYLKTFKQKYERNQIYTENVSGVGNLKLFISTDQSISGKWIAMFRTKGMKIFDYRCQLAQQQFSAIFMPNDKEVDEFLRSIENPTHDLFDPEMRISDETQLNFAKQKYFKIINWIKEKVVEFTKINIEEQDFMDGMEEYIKLLDSEHEKECNLKLPDVEIISYDSKITNNDISVLDKTGMKDADSDRDYKSNESKKTKRKMKESDHQSGTSGKGLIKEYDYNFSIKPKIVSQNNSIKIAFGLEDSSKKEFNIEIQSVGEDGNSSNYIPEIDCAYDCLINQKLNVEKNNIKGINNKRTNIIQVNFKHKFNSKYKIMVYTDRIMEDK